MLHEPALQSICISGLISCPDKLPLANHKLTGFRSEEANSFQPTPVFFLRWFRCSRRSVDKHQLSPALRAQIKSWVGCLTPHSSYGAGCGAEYETAEKQKNQSHWCILCYSIAVGLANILCDPEICFSKKGRWPRRAFCDFSVSSFYYKGSFFSQDNFVTGRGQVFTNSMNF